jgi:hypothetical protein
MSGRRMEIRMDFSSHESFFPLGARHGSYLVQDLV